MTHQRFIHDIIKSYLLYCWYVLDSSKQRTRLRSKNTLEKKKLDESITQYNIVNRLLEADLEVEDVTSENALDGNFPWIDPQDNKGTYSCRNFHCDRFFPLQFRTRL